MRLLGVVSMSSEKSIVECALGMRPGAGCMNVDRPACRSVIPAGILVHVLIVGRLVIEFVGTTTSSFT